MLRGLWWLQQNQDRYRRHAQALWLAYSLAIMVPAYLHFPHAAPLVTLSCLAPLVLPNVPNRYIRGAAAVYALVWIGSFGIALGPATA
jgi:hypothetical protein